MWSVKSLLEVWDKMLPEISYPENWVIRNWQHNYTDSEVGHAMDVVARKLEEGSLEDDNEDSVQRYMFGVLKRGKRDCTEIEIIVEQHREEKLGLVESASLLRKGSQ